LIIGLLICVVSIFLAFQWLTLDKQRVLIFSKAQGVRHHNIEYAIKQLPTFLPPKNWELTFTEDSTYFNSTLKEDFDSVVFLLTTGDVLNIPEQQHFRKFIESGGGFVGIHSAADTEHDWDWYGKLVGARFVDHTTVSRGRFSILDQNHPAMKHLDQNELLIDEWYEYQPNPRGSVHVLATINQGDFIDTLDYAATELALVSQEIPIIEERPITWCHTNLGGRSFYTGLGHTKILYQKPFLQKILKNALLWTGKVVDGDCSAGIDSNYNREVILDGIHAGMEIEVSSTGDVYFIERSGSVNVYSPKQDIRYQLASFDVFMGTPSQEFGLLGLTLDPGFETNRWIYLYYSHPSEPYEILSRFTEFDRKLDLSSEVELLKIKSERNACCHVGGSIEFDSEGNLYLSTGDNTEIDKSDGFAPLHEGIQNLTLDARRSAGNTNDLRGKILRIKPQPDGSYTIPQGNLFPKSDKTRAEIFVMGVRNPFRISIDESTGLLYWGDVGPDARVSATRGPRGVDEINRASLAGNYGWPFCIANNKPYKKPPPIDTGDFREWYDCNNLMNLSRWNTGENKLPAARGAFIWYPYLSSPIFKDISQIGNYRAAMAGPVYRSSDNKGFPAYYDGALFIYDWGRSTIKVVKIDTNLESSDGVITHKQPNYGDYVRVHDDLLAAYNVSKDNQSIEAWGKLHYENFGQSESRKLPWRQVTAGAILNITTFLPKEKFNRPIDMTFDEAGNLYVLEYGDAFNGSEGKISRIEYSNSTLQ